MPSTYSTNLALELIGTGDQAGVWGNTTNTNLGTLIEQAISGYVTQAVVTGTDTTITIPNGATGVARNMYIELTGTGGTNTNLIVPSNKKLYFIFNNSTGAVTVKVSGQTGVSVPQGKKVVLVSNGTDVVNGLNYIADFGTNSFTVTNLTATSATITTLTGTSAGITTISSGSANITQLNSTSATISTLTSSSATITNLTATSIVISNLSIASANITTLTSSSATISTTLALSGGTANGVLYLNGSKVATSGSALVFDGTNLGIGTASPSAKLSVSSGNIFVDNANGSVIVRNADATNQQQVRVRMSGTDGVLDVVRNSGTVPNLIFGTEGVERMRLDGNGNLGIGTSSPARKLTVADTNAAIGLVSANTGYSEIYFSDAAGSPGALSYNHNNDALSFYTSSNNRATIDASGNLGIGTTSPANRLHVVSSSQTVARFDATNTESNIRFDNSGATANLFGTAGAAFYWYSGSTERMRLDSSGNLGLGVTPNVWSTGKAIQIGSGAADLALFCNNNDSSISSNAYFNSGWKYQWATSVPASRYQQTNGTHVWFTAPSGTAGNNITFTQALTLDANVNLLLNGTAAPASGVGTFAIFNGTAPTGSVTNGCVLYTEDVSSSSELKVRDEAGNVTTLSPHNFSLIPEGPSEDMAWSYYSERDGKRINIDMLRAIRVLEKLSGEKLVHES